MYQPETKSYPIYYTPYVQLVLGNDLMDTLESHLEEMHTFLNSIPEELYEYAYQSGKWTLKDILMHLIDTERIFSYRVLKIIRGEGEGLISFDQDVFVANAGANSFQFSDLIEMYVQVRKSTIMLFRHLTVQQLKLTGSVNGNTISAGALGFIILGHEIHHQNVIKERYL